MKKIYTFLFYFFITMQTIYSQYAQVFIGTFNAKNEEGIYYANLNLQTGKLKILSSISGFVNPGYLDISPNGKNIYVCTNSETPPTGNISSFAINAKAGTLEFINSQPSGGDNPVYLDIHKNGKWLINGNYTGSSFSLFPINGDGSIGTAVQSFKFAGSSVHKERQQASHIHSSVFSPDYASIFLPDLGTDKIWCYSFNEEKPTPALPATIPFFTTTPGSGPRHFVFHPNQKFAYCIEEISGTVQAYSYKTGQLENLQRIAAHAESAQSAFGSGDIHISPDGKFLYASNRGNENNIAIFSIAGNGTLSIVGYQSTMGKHPRNFAISPNGKFLIVANVHTSNIVIFKRNFKTGLLTKVGEELKIKNPSCIKIR